MRSPSRAAATRSRRPSSPIDRPPARRSSHSRGLAESSPRGAAFVSPLLNCPNLPPIASAPSEAGRTDRPLTSHGRSPRTGSSDRRRRASTRSEGDAWRARSGARLMVPCIDPLWGQCMPRGQGRSSGGTHRPASGDVCRANEGGRSHLHVRIDLRPGRRRSMPPAFARRVPLHARGSERACSAVGRGGRLLLPVRTQHAGALLCGAPLWGSRACPFAMLRPEPRSMAPHAKFRSGAMH